MQKIKSIDDIASTKEEYDLLCNTDHLFIIKGKHLDDNGLIDVMYDLDHYEWFTKLRGDTNGNAKMHNISNQHEWMHGYVIAVSFDNLLNFEKSALLVMIQHGYNLERIDVFQTIKELKDEHFSSLFEEV